MNFADEVNAQIDAAVARERQMQALSTEALRAHLALMGWYPVHSRNAALQRGHERVVVVGTKRGLAVRYTDQYAAGTHPEVPWHSVNKGHLRMMAGKIARMP